MFFGNPELENYFPSNYLLAQQLQLKCFLPERELAVQLLKSI